MATKKLLSPVAEQEIINRIYVVRGNRVMLDSDLSEIYGVETRALNQAVSRNENRFPESFMFRLTAEEWTNLKSQNVISSWGGRRKLPSVFTEHGVLMLANVLKSSRAVEVSIKIIEIFVRLREALLTNQELLLKLEQLDKRLIMMGHDVAMHDGEIETIFEWIKEIMEAKMRARPRAPIGFKTKISDE
ncbi:ORF6N domain-containing protein [Niabella sp.]|uniref:ORF6N domain-containing protein n=1 Tax=Niabella sp. TaxID=1962976 RepID=UPI00262009E1|nr:ORF6N domain-containing protein [Niabella sp.]